MACLRHLVATPDDVIVLIIFFSKLTVLKHIKSYIFNAHFSELPAFKTQ